MSDFFKDVDNLDDAIGETIGFVSVCWDPKPTGMFESDKASKAVNELLKWIETHYTVTPKKTQIQEYAQCQDGLRMMRHDLCRGVLMSDGPYAYCFDCDSRCEQTTPCNCCFRFLNPEAKAKQNPK